MAPDREPERAFGLDIAMPIRAAADWADGISPCLRQLISAGADDSEISRYLHAMSTGDNRSASKILKRARAMAAPHDPLSIDSILNRVRVAAIKPVVNSLDATLLQHYMQHMLQISGAVVQKLKDEPFWSVDAAVGAVADVVRRACMDLLDSNPDVARGGQPSAPFQAGREAGVGTVTNMVALIGIAEFAVRLGWPVGQVNRALATGSVFAIETDGMRLIPSFFADSGFDGRQVRAVCRILGGLPGGSKLQFFTSPKASLGARTPLELLAERRFAAVKAAARGFVER